MQTGWESPAVNGVSHSRDLSGSLACVRASGDLPAVDRHAHVSWILGRLDRGSRTLTLGRKRFTLGPGDGFLVPADFDHAWSAAPGGACRILCLDPERYRCPEGRAGPIRDPAWAGLFDATFVLAESGLESAEAAVPVLLAATAAAAPLSDPRPARPGPVLRARELGADRLDQKLLLADLGRQAGMSPFHLHRLYRAAFGVTPAQHRLEARLRTARALMLAGVPVAQAAAATGFADQSHLARVFHRWMGVAPTTWLTQVRRTGRADPP